MIAAKPNTDFDGNAFSAPGMDSNSKVSGTVNKINRNSTPKRSTNISCSNAAPVKKIRYQHGMDPRRLDVNSGIGATELQSSAGDYLQANKARIDKASDGIAHQLQVYNQIFGDNTKKIEQLQADLDKLNNKTQDLEQKNTTLINERKVFQRMIDGLKNEKQKMSDEKKKSDESYKEIVNAALEAKETFENTKKILVEQNRALKMEMEKSDGEKKALEQKNEELERFRNQIYQLAKPAQ